MNRDFGNIVFGYFSFGGWDRIGFVRVNNFWIELDG